MGIVGQTDIHKSNCRVHDIEKRASYVRRLAEENERLNKELKEMSDRLAAAEARTRAMLESRGKK